MAPHTLQTIEVPIASLREDPYNARKHGKRNIQSIVDSLRKFGQVLPLLVRAEDNVVIGGNGRVEAMRMLQWTMCTIAPLHISESYARELSIVLNQSATHATWDWGALSENLRTIIDEQGIENIVTGFSSKEITKLCEAYETPTIDPAAGVDLDAILGTPSAPAQPSDPNNSAPTQPDTFPIVVYCASEQEAHTVLGILQQQGLRAEALAPTTKGKQ